MTEFEAWTLGIASMALMISLASLAISIYFGLLDRAKLQIESNYYPDTEYSKGQISIAITNAGRRPTSILMWAGEDDEGNWVGSYFRDAKQAVRLDEHARQELTLYAHDLVANTQDDVVIFSKLWIEDSLGKRHSVPNSEQYIKNLMVSK